MTPLDSLAIGESGRVSKIGLQEAESQRFQEMGLTVGSTIKLLKVAPLGDPIEILLRGYHLSLRKAEARSIWVEPIS